MEMRKFRQLMVALLVAMAAFTANSASLSWNVRNVISSPDNEVTAGWLVQVFETSVEYDYAKVKSGEISAWSSSTVQENLRVVGKEENVGIPGEKMDISLYMVIYDAADVASAKNYIVSDSLPLVVSAAGNDVTGSFGSMTSTSTTNKFRNSTWTAVPEPTSGLLALLGFAGLALRRRRG